MQSLSVPFNRQYSLEQTVRLYDKLIYVYIEIGSHHECFLNVSRAASYLNQPPCGHRQDIEQINTSSVLPILFSSSYFLCLLTSREVNKAAEQATKQLAGVDEVVPMSLDEDIIVDPILLEDEATGRAAAGDPVGGNLHLSGISGQSKQDSTTGNELIQVVASVAEEPTDLAAPSPSPSTFNDDAIAHSLRSHISASLGLNLSLSTTSSQEADLAERAAIAALSAPTNAAFLEQLNRGLVSGFDEHVNSSTSLNEAIASYTAAHLQPGLICLEKSQWQDLNATRAQSASAVTNYTTPSKPEQSRKEPPISAPSTKGRRTTESINSPRNIVLSADTAENEREESNNPTTFATTDDGSEADQTEESSAEPEDQREQQIDEDGSVLYEGKTTLRGRPKGKRDGPNVIKEKRGRPPGARNFKGLKSEREERERLESGLPPPEPKKRGRPPGAKNRRRLGSKSATPSELHVNHARPKKPRLLQPKPPSLSPATAVAWQRLPIENHPRYSPKSLAGLAAQATVVSDSLGDSLSGAVNSSTGQRPLYTVHNSTDTAMTDLATPNPTADLLLPSISSVGSMNFSEQNSKLAYDLVREVKARLAADGNAYH